MTISEEDTTFEQLVQKVAPHSKLLRRWNLKGGVSAQVTALEIEQPDGTRKKLVVRQHGAGDLKRNPHIAADEWKLLQILQSAELAAPKPYYVDRSGEIFSTPFIVIEYIEGQPEAAPAHVADLALQLATQLYKIHKVDCSSIDVSFLPKQEAIVAQKLRERPIHIDASLDEGRIREALAAIWPLSQPNPSVLLHGDFWPGNIVWNAGQLVAVLDWEDAALGDPLADVANSRLEILWAYGIDAMRCFTEHYASMTTIDFVNLPYWDLYAALRPASKIAAWAGDPNTEKTMREGHRLFVAQAFEKLTHVC